MKKDPGRKERRRLMFANRRAEGKRKAKIHDYMTSHRFLKKYQEG